MTEVRQTEEFKAWLAKLRDREARAKISIRIDRLERGNPGDIKPIGEGVSERQMNSGTGYRLYFTR